MVQWRCICGGGEVLSWWFFNSKWQYGHQYYIGDKLRYRNWSIGINENYGPWNFATDYGRRASVIKRRFYDENSGADLEQYYSHINHGMGFANRNTKKNGREDVDFVGLLRLPIEFGGKLCKVGVFVKLMPDKKTQYLSLRFMEHESVAENIITKKTEQLLDYMIKTGDIYELPGVREKYGDIVGVEVEGFDEINEQY